MSHILLRGLPSILYWKLWRERCSRVYDEGRQSAFSIFLKVCYVLALGVEKECKVRFKAIWVGWSFPLNGMLKLNLDGALKGNPGLAGGEAVVRNQWGQLVLATSFLYGEC